ncbi:hypothetical protein FND36_07220 [Lachnospiraceae bacterium KGMB03038]|nr:hypothetical protein FND36_07220 [Lachnospiraceae bacterium KGMB03038]
MADYLVESALLSQGLGSITEQEMLASWPASNGRIAWMWKGSIMTGILEEFCQIRKTGILKERIHFRNFERAVIERKTGAFTASGTMKACEKLGIPLTVSGGIGGLNEREGFKSCHDLEALICTHTALLATAPKDMFDLTETVETMKEAGIQVIGHERDRCDGYLFRQRPARLSGRWMGERAGEKRLFFQEIPLEKRLADPDWLRQACEYGTKERKEGREYHPAVNKKLEQLSGGKSAWLQFRSLTANLLWAEEMT